MIYPSQTFSGCSSISLNSVSSSFCLHTDNLEFDMYSFGVYGQPWDVFMLHFIANKAQMTPLLYGIIPNCYKADQTRINTNCYSQSPLRSSNFSTNWPFKSGVLNKHTLGARNYIFERWNSTNTTVRDRDFVLIMAWDFRPHSINSINRNLFRYFH